MAAAKRNIAGKFGFERKAMLRDESIREDNDGSRIKEPTVVRNVKNNKKGLFKGQSAFIAEYRRRAG